MNLEAYLSELHSRHQLLESEIRDEMMSPSADSLKITELKRRKLRIKDKIALLAAKEAA